MLNWRRLSPGGWFRKWLGDRGERLAARHLRRQGLRIIARQVRSHGGEIDLIALDGDCVVFVEVKSRRWSPEASPAEAVTVAKQRKITRAALTWLKRRGLLERRCRFDVVAITWRTDAPADVVHYRGAFEAADLGQMF